MGAISTTRCRTASITDFREYLRIRGLHTPLLRDFYAQSHFTQWKWKTHQYDQQSNDHIGEQNSGAFCSRSVTRHRSSVTQHVLSRSSSRPGHEADLQRKGIRIVHIDEYRTSQACPCCNGKTETFRLRRNPRPWRSDTKSSWFEKVHPPNRCKTSLHALLESRS